MIPPLSMSQTKVLNPSRWGREGKCRKSRVSNSAVERLSSSVSSTRAGIDSETSEDWEDVDEGGFDGTSR